MIGKMLLWTLLSSCTSVSVITPQGPVMVYSGETAILPVSIQFQNPKQQYFHAQWVFLTQGCPILYYNLNCPTTLPESQKHTCQQVMETEGRYRERANISEHASLVLRDVNPEDAGIYEVTVQALDESGRARVELVIMEATRKDLRSMVTKTPNPVGKGRIQKPGLAATGNPSPSYQEGSLERHSIENIIRMLLACFVLGILGWLFWECVCPL